MPKHLPKKDEKAFIVEIRTQVIAMLLELGLTDADIARVMFNVDRSSIHSYTKQIKKDLDPN